MEHKELQGVSESLYIPLLGRAQAWHYGHILRDEKAEDMVRLLKYDFKKLKQSRFLSIYMAIRGAILDEYVVDFLHKNPGATVLHLGCGLDSRCLRAGGQAGNWVDIDLPPVIEVRRRFFTESNCYRMLPVSVTESGWLETISATGPVLVVAEGLTMYFTQEQNEQLLRDLQDKFSRSEYVFDAYSCSAVWWSKWKNPVNKMGAVIRWGLDDPGVLEAAVPGVRYLDTSFFTEHRWSDQLSGSTRCLFRFFYGNSWANNLYRIYHFLIAPKEQ